MEKLIQLFKIVSTLEALSFLVLLGIAMPLKYIWNEPFLVQSVGMAHGLLFILYLTGTVFISQKLDWAMNQLGVAVVCSVVPFGPFYVERKYLK